MKNTFLTILILLFSVTAFGQNKGEKLYNLVVKNDTENAIKLISENADVNYVKESGWVKVNTLISAINNVNVEIVKSLLEHNADVNWKDGFNTTALMYAASKGNREIVDLLLKYGADINANDGEGNTVLTAAKESKNSELIALIEVKMKR
jgi:ankyrin repeat protein